MRDYGLVSIVMPTWNCARFIGESIESVRRQSYRNWELLVVDDCSADNTEKVVMSFGDSRIRYIRNAVNSGAAVSRNRALKEARGRWIAFLDSDDLWTADKLERQIAFMVNNGYSFSYTNYSEVDEDTRETGVCVSGPRRISVCGMFNYCWPGCLTVMYDASVIGVVQIADIKKNNDYAMWLKAIKKADCFLLDENLAGYRKRTGSISNHSYVSLVKWHYLLFREAERQNVVLSFINTLRNLFWGAIKKKLYVRNAVQ